MPVTARLSRAFYDRLGDEVANELVGWFNDVDASYRGDLRELNELNFARADATFAQRLAQSETRMIERMARVESRLLERMAQLEVRMSALEVRIQALETRMDAQLQSLESRLEARIQKEVGRLYRWMFIAWSTLMLALIGILQRV